MEISSILKGSQLLQKKSNDSFTPVRNRSVMQEAQRHHDKLQEETNNLSKDEAKKLIGGLNRFLDPTDSSIKFEYHDKLEEYYLTIVDQETKEIIQEIPPKKLLDIYAGMAEFMGLLVDEKI